MKLPGIALTFPPEQWQKLQPVAILNLNDDDSSGDEEVLEDSAAVSQDDSESSGDEEVVEDSAALSSARSTVASHVVSPVVPVAGVASLDRTLFNRYSHCKKEMIDCIRSTIEARAGLVDGFIGGSFSVIATMKTFCHVPKIRHMASMCFDKWISNPAFIEHVKDLIVHLAGYLELGDSNVSAENAFNDMEIVESIVKLKSRLQASQLDVHRSILASIAKKGAAVAQLVVRILILEDTMSHYAIPTTRQETLKTLIHILKDVSQVDGDEVQGSIRTGSVFGEAIGQICRGAADKWCSANSKTFVELIVRVIRGLDTSKIDLACFLLSLLGNSSATAAWIHRNFSIDNEVLKFYSDVAIAIQLIASNEVAMLKSNSVSTAEAVPMRAPTLGRGVPGRGTSSVIMRGNFRSTVPTLKKSVPVIIGRETSSSSADVDLPSKTSASLTASTLLRGNLKVQETAAQWISKVAFHYRNIPQTT